MKKCPHCSEEIQDSAKKCKHCGEWLMLEKKEIKNYDKYINLGGILGGILFVLVLTKLIYNAGLLTGAYTDAILARRFGGDLVILYISYIVGYLAGRGSIKNMTTKNILRKVIIGIVVGVIVSGFIGLAQINGYK